MRILVDSNILLAVALNEPEKTRLIDLTQEMDLAAPEVLPYEIGNALSGLFKRKRLPSSRITDVWKLLSQIPVELIGVDIPAALTLAGQFDIYAYDAYFLQTALQLRCPLLTLDRGMRRIANILGIPAVEKP
ncbi:MAG: type II toxin-antitoxin system VapC family toxin [Phycisphaerae bacterium]|nr:type II toxin-antitoxin system VapC family toxin [Phycisphaerae bacterium]